MSPANAGVITRNVRGLGVVVLGMSLYQAATVGIHLAIVPIVCASVGLLLSLKLQPRPGPTTNRPAPRAGWARVGYLLGSACTVGGAIPLVLGGLWLVVNGLRTAGGANGSHSGGLNLSLALLAACWLISVVGMLVVDWVLSNSGDVPGE